LLPIDYNYKLIERQNDFSDAEFSKEFERRRQMDEQIDKRAQNSSYKP
jgi:hypothetical protein